MWVWIFVILSLSLIRAHAALWPVNGLRRKSVKWTNEGKFQHIDCVWLQIVYNIHDEDGKQMLQTWCKQQRGFKQCPWKWEITVPSGRLGARLFWEQESLYLFLFCVCLHSSYLFNHASLLIRHLFACVFPVSLDERRVEERSALRAAGERCILLASIVAVLIMKFDYNFLPAGDPLALISLVQMLPVPGEASLTGLLSTGQQELWYGIQKW